MASKKISLTKPKYQQIAVDVAEKIAEGKLHVGDKIHARSTLANQYQVSPETARKAIIVLVDLEIVKAKHGSGFIKRKSAGLCDTISRRSNDC